MTGGDLDQYIKNNKTIDPDIVTQIFLKICVGINAMHRNQIVHRDIKPANILITKTGNVKICDFGICKVLDYSKVTGTMVGTPYFMSPEQMNNRHYDYKSDVWGIGCVLYCLLYNKYPFSGRTMVDLKRNIRTKDPFVGIKPGKEALHNILKDMLDKNKVKRPDLATFLANASNQKLIAHYKIRDRISPFRKYSLQSVPSSERDWISTVDKLRRYFHLPTSLYSRTQEILRETRLPNDTTKGEVPEIVSYADIKRGRIKPSPPPARPVLPRVRPPRQSVARAPIRTPSPCRTPNARPIIARSSIAKRDAPRQVCHIQPTRPLHRRTPAMVRPQTPLYRPEAKPPRQRILNRSPALRKHEPLLNYLRNKNYPPKPTPTAANNRLPRIKNKYKDVQSKVRKYWA